MRKKILIWYKKKNLISVYFKIKIIKIRILTKVQFMVFETYLIIFLCLY